ncbi:hypothetical protein MVEN_00564300 [Mycena venus]|uniref:BTB domain-containing protein n=1 Tax=Mycena venus TaxID=2733690 RepID=A0A8H6YP03_9AGAR|nr:hypothetical protein MVEN_00564300 [Mycena venus]
MDSESMVTNETSTSQSGLVRAEGLWFADGGLVIQAETTLFRVYRELLALHAVVFRDMLTIPTPDDAEVMEGCPLVRLPDNAEDTAYFLKALLYPQFFEPFPAPTTYPIVAGVLRMSHKYDVEALRKRALAHLSALFPTTLDGWDDVSLDPTFCDTLPSYLVVVILARQVDALWILPHAFYCLSREEDADKIIIHGDQGLELSAADKLACLSGVRTLETTSASEVLEFLYDPRHIPGCQTPAVCAEVRAKARFIAEDSRRYFRGNALDDVLPLNIWRHDDWSLLELCCRTCIAEMKVNHQKARQSVWDELPQIFGLSSWAELERMKAEALQ